MLAAIAACFLLPSAGCSKQCDPQVASLSAENENLIVPGYGIPSCHLGMAVADLQGDWQMISTQIEQDLSNITAGIVIRRIAGRVHNIGFYYTGEGVKPSTMKTQLGIGAESSIEETIKAYGQPISMSVTGSEGVESVTLWYFRRGLLFIFSDGVLDCIGIIKAVSEVPPEDVGDIGDTSKYRAIFVGE